MISFNLIYMLFVFCVFSMGTDFLIQISGVFPNQITQLFNATLVHHYGIYVDETVLSLGLSMSPIAESVGWIVGNALFISFMDSKGRRWVCVHLRFYLVSSAALLTLTGILTGSYELFLLGKFVTGLHFPIIFIVTQVYIAECTPDKYRGFVSGIFSNGDVVSLLVLYLTGRSTFLGSERWFMFPLLSLLISVMLLLLTLRLPDSPKYLVSRIDRKQMERVVRFYHGNEADVDEIISSFTKEKNLTSEEVLSLKEIWNNETTREALLILLSIKMLHVVAPNVAEKNNTVLVQTSLGFTVDESLSLNSLLTFVFIPILFVGSYLIEKYGRRFVIFSYFSITYFKILLMFTAQIIINSQGASSITKIMGIINESSTRIASSVGIGAISPLLVTELFPPSARAKMSQLGMYIACFSSTIFIAIYPILNQIWAPAFYIPFLFIQPPIIYFLYKKFPETKQRPVYKIIQDFDKSVRSRGGSTISYGLGFKKMKSIVRKRSKTFNKLEESRSLIDTKERNRAHTEIAHNHYGTYYPNPNSSNNEKLI